MKIAKATYLRRCKIWKTNIENIAFEKLAVNRKTKNEKRTSDWFSEKKKERKKNFRLLIAMEKKNENQKNENQKNEKKKIRSQIGWLRKCLNFFVSIIFRYSWFVICFFIAFCDLVFDIRYSWFISPLLFAIWNIRYSIFVIHIFLVIYTLDVFHIQYSFFVFPFFFVFCWNVLISFFFFSKLTLFSLIHCPVCVNIFLVQPCCRMTLSFHNLCIVAWRECLNFCFIKSVWTNMS